MGRADHLRHGVTELLGAIGLMVPMAIYRRVGVPFLRRWTGIAVTLQLGGLMIANINVALRAQSGIAYPFAPWLYWLRLVFQVVLIAWALFATEVIVPPASSQRFDQRDENDSWLRCEHAR
jgi:uncharacterized membrane protein